MAHVETIVVGGGIAATNPFTVGAVPFITSATPPAISATTVMGYTTGTGGIHPGIVIAAAFADPQPAALELLRVKGGAIIEGSAADSVVIGRGASDSAVADGVAIGRGAVSNNASVAIGRLASGGFVSIGPGATQTVSSGIAIGQNATVTGFAGTDAPIAIGGNSIAQNLAGGQTSIAIGGIARRGSICISGNATGADGLKAICIGDNSQASGNIFSAESNNVVVGSSSLVNNASAIHATVIGSNCSFTAVHNGIVLGWNSASTQNGTILIGVGLAPLAVGEAVIGINDPAQLGDIITQLRIGGPDTSTVARNLTIRGINASGVDTQAGVLAIAAPLNTGAAFGAGAGEIQFKAGGVIASGAALQTLRTRFRVLANDGTVAAAPVEFDDVLSTAAAAVATLNNSPVAGNPTFWLPVVINGVKGNMPIW